MEPLSALSFADNILNLVELSAKLLSKGNAIFKSANGTLAENDGLEVIANRLRDLTSTLENSIGITSGQNELALLAINALASRLEMFRGELNTCLLLSVRQKIDSNASEQNLLLGTLINSHQNGLNSQSDAHSTTQEMLAYENSKTREEITAAIFQMAEWGLNARYPEGISISYHEAKKQARRLAPTSIIESLAYPMQQDRFEGIHEAYMRTFDWVWLNHHEHSISVRHDLTRWLKEGNGLFWISGKPGSGKSTFMKYISRDPKTMQYLSHWADGGQFVFGQFFFWKSGSVLQRSQTGLLRSLIYSALRQFPELIEAILPGKLEQMEQVLTDHLYGSQLDAQSLSTFSVPSKLRYELESWPLSDLSNAFDKLLQQTTVDAKIFFLIDGLDEYDGDHSEIVRLFQKASSSPTVKICMSSRPLNVYERAFDTLPGFRIQDLTVNDIKLYVSEKIKQHLDILLLSNREPSQGEQLIRDIVGKASGVFLWVALVVKSLLDGFTNQDTMSDLQKRLDLLPPDLEDLYRYMISKIDPIYRPRASRFFQIVSSANGTMQTLNLSLADEDDISCPLTAKIELMPLDEQYRRVLEIKARTRSVCAGLLEVHHWGRRTCPENSTLRDFTAGTVFQTNIAMLGSCILQLKWLIKQPKSTTECSKFWDVVQQALLIASEADSDGSNFGVDLLDELDRVATHHWSSCIEGNPKLNHETGHWTNWMPQEYDSSNVLLNSSFISHTVRYQLSSYLRSKIQHDPRVIHPSTDRPLLSVAIPPISFTGFQATPAPQSPSWAIIESLLESGADPNESYMGQSPWQNALQQVCGYQPSPLDDHASSTLRFGQMWTRIFDILLYYGADIDAEINNGNAARSALAVTSDLLHKFDPAGAKEVQRKLLASGATYYCQLNPGEVGFLVPEPFAAAGGRDNLQRRLRVPYRLRSIIPEDGARHNLYKAARWQKCGQ
ncbi:hypothetical protein BKA65DRAFT_546261 [Rhexocercosporidium sp. MPI-PUGE-AT-0058]|nr:hypothetical protein BKA65DRAFT_546261 [Rhexocercosporidium sp. MPI-PUGE-AT-0058]